jgi:micrococcal nuclease
MKAKQIILVLGFILFSLICVQTFSQDLPVIEEPNFAQLTAYPVVRVVDGDTIVINDGNEIKVRLIGVDTPETVHPSKPVEYYGKEASRFTQNLLKGEKVYLVTDPQQSKTDKYGRSLAYVYRAPDGLFVNAEIIRQGYGHAYTTYPCKYLDEFRQLERFARKTEKGLWEPVPENRTPAVKAIPPTVAPVIKPQKETPSDVEDVIVCVTKTGSKYHRCSCSYLRKSSIPMKLKDAKASGYTPCSRCNPPQ